MHIFLSGATGVIGRRVVPRLVAAGHAVTAMARNDAGDERLRQLGARPVRVDLFDAAALVRALRGHDAVINLATHIPSSSLKMLFRRSWRLNDCIRTVGVSNLVDAALACGVPRLIQESFAPIYVDQGDEWISEDTELAPAAYNASVLDAEASVRRFEQAGRTGVVLRFAGFYGPDAIQVNSYINALNHGWAALPGDPQRFISSVSHDDAASAAVAALKVPSGTYNVTDDEPVRRIEFFGALARDLGLPPPRFMPGWVGSLFGAVGETMARSLRLSNRKLRAASDWKPAFASVREGWRATLAEMKALP